MPDQTVTDKPLDPLCLLEAARGLAAPAALADQLRLEAAVARACG